MAGIARSVRRHGQPLAAPGVLLSGGETTVTVRGDGRGGRNVEFLLALAVALDGLAGIWGLAGDTDGIDGAEEVAGAIVAPDTLARARAAGLEPAHGMLAAERRPQPVRRAGRPGGHRPDADQRQRFPRRAGAAGGLAGGAGQHRPPIHERPVFRPQPRQIDPVDPDMGCKPLLRPRNAAAMVRPRFGGMAEWFKAHAWKACWGQLLAGSNPAPSANVPSNSLILRANRA